MNDYRNVSILEAAHTEMMNQFVQTIKILDEKVACQRLTYLLNCNIRGVSFDSVIGQFNSLAGHKTSAD